MLSGYIGQQIRRCNRNLLITNVLLIAIVLLITFPVISAGGLTEHWFLTLCGLVILMVGGWNLWNWRKRTSDCRCHPIYVRLSVFGNDPEQLAQQIDSARQSYPPTAIGSVSISGPWMLKTSPLGLTFFFVPDVVWVYQKVTTHKTNGVPTGKSFALLVYDRHGYSAEVQSGKNNVEGLMAYFRQQCPWALSGYGDDLVKMWRSRRAELIAAVDERRKYMTGLAAGA